MSDKERYGTITAFHRLFQQEGVEVSFPTIASRIESAKKQGKISVVLSGRLKSGKILHESFYRETEVRESCTDLFRGLPRADEDGYLEIDGETYGTFRGLSQALGISQEAIQLRIQNSSLKPIQGKDKTGHDCDFYRLSVIRELCEALTQDLPRVCENGFLEIDGNSYGTFLSLSRHLNISQAAVRLRIQRGAIKPIRGKNRVGRIFDFYLLSDVQKLCEYLIQDLPQADENGYLNINGKSYGTIRSLARRFGISKTTVQSRIQNGTLESIRGKDKINRIFDFYPETEVQKLCADLIAKCQKSDD